MLKITNVDLAFEMKDDVALLHPYDSLDLVSGTQLRVHPCFEKPQSDVVLDLSGVSYIDSDGVGAIIHAVKRLTRAEKKLVLAAPTATALRALKAMAIDQVVPITDSVERALELLKAG